MDSFSILGIMSRLNVSILQGFHSVRVSMLNLQSASMMVMVDALLVAVRLLPMDVLRESTMPKNSSHSTSWSSFVITGTHISVPLIEPTENVKGMVECEEKSMPAVAII